MADEPTKQPEAPAEASAEHKALVPEELAAKFEEAMGDATRVDPYLRDQIAVAICQHIVVVGLSNQQELAAVAAKVWEVADAIIAAR